MTETVSAVITTFNRSETLARSIDSVLAQTRPCEELIVVDHGSEDQTSKVIASFGSRVRLVHLARDPLGRPAVSRNAGVRAASGSMVCFLDDDDIWEPNKIEIQLEASTRHPHVGLICSDALRIDADGSLMSERYLAQTSGFSGKALKQLLRDNFVITSSVMAPVELIKALGGFNEHPGLRAVEDYELWLRIAAIREVMFIPDPLVRYRIHDHKLSSQQSKDPFKGRRSAIRRAMSHAETRRYLPSFTAAICRDYLRSLITLSKGER
ncbi:MAG TPA: glycosyltransferase [Actinomycetota bacterium]|nr:glycosyltransferase [Actinomycetota bacterium]